MVVDVAVKSPHPKQLEFLSSRAKRIVIKAGRRGGKTVGCALKAVGGVCGFEIRQGPDGNMISVPTTQKRVLYAAPTTDQTDRFWMEVTRMMENLISSKDYKKNEKERIIEIPRTDIRIRAKTAWNANTMRGDYADLLILDEWQLMDENAWNEVGAPMLLDNNGDAMFIFTPPSLRSSGISKAEDPRHASKLFQAAQEDKSGRWAAFHFTSHENPHLSVDGLREITRDMSIDAYRKEILAEDEEIEQSWLVYGSYNHATQTIPPFKISEDWPRYVGHDFGQANPAALFVAQSPRGEWYVYDEYLPGSGRSTAQHVEEFKRLTIGLTVVRRVGGNQTTEDEIRQGYGAHGWFISAPLIRQPRAQLDRVIGLMERNQIFVFSSCKHYLSEISNCLWELSNDNKPLDKVKDEPRYHLSACARYLFSDFRPETVQPGGLVPVIKRSVNRFGG